MSRLIIAGMSHFAGFVASGAHVNGGRGFRPARTQ